MRFLIMISVCMLLLLSSCIREKEKYVSKVDELLLVTDGLLDLVQNQFDFTTGNFYLLIDDSLRLDSLIENINQPDSTGFYQILEQNMIDINEIFIQAQREIYFTQEQLLSLKEEYKNNEISKSEYLQETSDVHEMIRFLKKRVDTNICLINEKYNTFFGSVKDTVQK